MKNVLRIVTAFCLLATLSTSAKAQLTITALFSGTDTTGFFSGSSPVSTLSDASTAEATIQAALDAFDSEITTTTPENLTISFLSYPSGLGASTPFTAFTDISFSTYLADLAALPKSANDIAAQASLNAMPYAPDTQIKVSAADLFALGDTADANSLFAGNHGLAGTVALNFNLLSTSRANEGPDQYDLISVVSHEVDELLGIGGFGTSLGTAGATDIGVLDPFRYSAPGIRSSSTSSDITSYFSLDGGVTKIAYFNQSSGGDYGDYGDGVAPADGSSSANGGSVQDAFTSNHAENNLGPAELSALDAVGYTLTPLGAQVDGLSVPEPSSYALMFGGLVVFGTYRRFRNIA
jgi:hypothetical protein